MYQARTNYTTNSAKKSFWSPKCAKKAEDFFSEFWFPDQCQFLIKNQKPLPK